MALYDTDNSVHYHNSSNDLPMCDVHWTVCPFNLHSNASQYYVIALQIR